MPGWGCGSVMEYLPNLCMAPGFIPHCPNCITYIISPLCLLNTHLFSPSSWLLFRVSSLPQGFPYVFGGRRKMVLPVYCPGGGRGKFYLSVIWGGGDIIRCSGIASWDFHHCPGTSVLKTPPIRNWRWTD